MENLILWGAPIIGALIGLGARLLKSYVTLLNFTFAVYLALWSEGLLSSLYRLPGAAEPYKSAGTMLFCALLAGVLLKKVSDSLMPDEREFIFPPLMDKLGGGLCGFLAGMVLVNFAAFVFCTTPQKTAAAEFISLPALERASTGNLITLSGVIDGLSFQSTSSPRRGARLNELIRQADPPPPPEERPAPQSPVPANASPAPAR